jgi:hypothetical protein
LEQKSDNQPPATPGGAAERGEHWWPVALSIVAVGGLHVALPARYRVNPPWVLPVVPWAKLMMMTEAAVSLIIGLLVVARAVNILK